MANGQQSASVKMEEQASWVRQRLQALIDEVRMFAITRDGYVPWTYPQLRSRQPGGPAELRLGQRTEDQGRRGQV